MNRSSWIRVQSIANLATFSGGTPQELHSVVVTDVMVEAAKEYFYSLYDPSFTDTIIEDLFRIMSVLQPRAQAVQAEPLELC